MERGYEVGLINAIAEPGKSLDRARQLAQRIAGFDQRVLNTAKHVIQNVPVDDAAREAALKEVRLGTLTSQPPAEDRIINTRFAGDRQRGN